MLNFIPDCQLLHSPKSSTSGERERRRERGGGERVTWPSQPVRLYRVGERERERDLVFYAQSASTVTSGGERETWCFTPSQPVRLYQRERE